MNLKQADQITGGLSNPAKMPCKAYNLPASACKTGSKLRKVKDSPCSSCYACKGRYVFPNVQDALGRRLRSITTSDWTDAMVLLITKRSKDYFRWHDSGDIQDEAHLMRILDVCEQTPDVEHWLPTMEVGIVERVSKMRTLPENLIIRRSSPKVDKPLTGDYTSSVVYTDGLEDADHIFKCPATVNHNTCEDNKCRACWDSTVKTVGYKKH